MGKQSGVKTVQHLVDYYLHSPRFRQVSGRTQKEYEAQLEKALATKLSSGKTLGDMRISMLRVPHMTECYEQWLEIGVPTANRRMAVLSVCWKYAVQMDLVRTDPVAPVKRRSVGPRRVLWTKDQVKTFLDTAYSKFEYRSMGLIVHMAYEWGQRVGDMRVLKWDKLDLDAQRIDMTQSKRKADIHLPISDSLTAMLRQQHADFGFQEYVAPHTKPRAGAYTPYKEDEIALHINKIKDEANLPKHITARDLRRTAVTEMLEGGVDMAGIMQVTGHRNPQSLTPYMVNTYSGASAALAARGGKKDD